MSVEVIKEIKQRWDAKSLVSTITGGLYHSQVPVDEAHATLYQMPYATISEVSNTIISRTRDEEVSLFVCQWDVYVDDSDPESAYDKLKLILDTFNNSENASANPLQPDVVKICDARVASNPVTLKEGDRVFRSSATQEFVVVESRTLTPS